MKKTGTSTDIINTQNKIDFSYQPPSKCPRCNTAIDATVLSSFFINYDFDKKTIFILFFCHCCERSFLGEYKIFDVYNEAQYGTFIPYGDFDRSFSENINLLSPNFVKIYNQSNKAENMGLYEICGMGYRKALEFLIKDFAIALTPNDSDLIKDKFLSACIDDHIESPHIKSLSKASAWIGNDETHYVRRHKDYSIDHLKAFMDAIVSHIDSELSYLEAKQLLGK